MEVSAVNCGDVAVPDEISSGTAGTGYEYLGAARTHEVCTGEILGRWSRGKTGPGLHFSTEPDVKTGPGLQAAGRHEPEENPGAWYGDPAFPLTGGLEPISVRLDKKIDRQGRRLLWIEERGRP